MPNSIRTTSNTQATTNSAPATFKAGDSVLCPSLGLRDLTFTLIAELSSKSKLLVIKCHDRCFRFDVDGFLVSANECETAEYTPRLYQDTPANRAAIATLYGPNIGESIVRTPKIREQNTPLSKIVKYENNKEENAPNKAEPRTAEQRFSGIPASCSPIRKVIDLTDYDDDEVILMSSCLLSDTACEVLGAAEVMHDIGQLLYLIYNEKISTGQVKSMARLVHDTTDRWDSILYRLLDTLNEPLEQTKFGKVEG